MSNLYKQWIGECATADEGKLEAKVGDIRTIAGASADFFWEELKRVNINFTLYPRLSMLAELGKSRAKKRKK